MRVIGIDPGLNGALALVCEDTAAVYDLPVKIVDRRRTIDPERFVMEFSELLRSADHVVVEEQGPRPRQGARQTFTHGYEYGVVVALIEGLGISPLFVTPRRWKAELGLSSDKAQSLEAARRMWPELEPALRRKRDDGRAEALLIAWYARRVLSTSGVSAFTTRKADGPASRRRRGSGRTPSRRNSGRSPSSRKTSVGERWS